MDRHQKDIKKLEKSMKQNMGLDIELTRKELPTRQEMNNALDLMGKDLCPTGMKYAGSVNIFMFVSSADLHLSGGSLAVATNFTGDTPLSLAAVRAMLDASRVDIIKHYTTSYAQAKEEQDAESNEGVIIR